VHVDGLKSVANAIRRRVIELSHSAGTPHLGSALSCVDILVSLYWTVLRVDPNKPDEALRDRFILSKGHAALALYVTLARRGFFGEDVLETFNRDGSRLAEHPGAHGIPGVEAATGSLGHGLPLGIGMTLAGRIHRQDYRVFVLMSDGECNEGAVWEGALLAPAQWLDNLVVIIDYNKWQATARSDSTMSLAPLRQKWEAFGWQAMEVDGHSFDELGSALADIPNGTGKPVAVVAHTVKGRGVSFMEDDNNWHYRVPSADEVRRAARELQGA
jgi:transketolase